MTTTLQSIPERVLTIGPDQNVIGIVTEAPARAGGGSPEPDRPNIMFLNAGVLHRVGPHRLHVTLARLLAAEGFRGLRIDLSGIGDSRNLPGTLTFRESSIADARSAMDCLPAQSGVAQFICFGLCSGADNGLATALADERVVGLILVDPPTYATIRSHMRALGDKLSSFRGAVVPMAAWAAGVAARRARQYLQTLMRRLTGRDSNVPTQAQGRALPLPEELYSQFSALLDRGVRILCVFSGANGAGYNDREQLYESFPRLRGRMDVMYFPAANHVFTELDARAALLGAVTGWCRENFG